MLKAEPTAVDIRARAEQILESIEHDIVSINQAMDCRPFNHCTVTQLTSDIR